MTISPVNQQPTSNHKPRIAHIVAAATNGVIGRDGDLPWKIPQDMKWFRDRTKNRVLIMGRKTFESVGHPLPNRANLIVTRQSSYVPKFGSTPTAPVEVFTNIETALKRAQTMSPDFNNEIFIIGGGEIYHQSVNMVDTIYLTRVQKHVDGDATYPAPSPETFQLLEETKFAEAGDVPAFSIQTWVRKSAN
jgi:dihydrofolate reductase